MRLVVLALVLAASASAQSSLADGDGFYLSLADADVIGTQTLVDAAAGWRWTSGTDVGLFLQDERSPNSGGRYAQRRLGVEVGQTWAVSPRLGVRVSGSASLNRRSFDDVTLFTRRASDSGDPIVDSRQATATFRGSSADLEASAFVRLRLAGSVGVRPGLGLFVHHESLASEDADARLFALGPVGDPRDAVGVRIALPVTARVLGTDLALSPVIRAGVGIRDHASYVDGGMRLHVNL